MVGHQLFPDDLQLGETYSQLVHLRQHCPPQFGGANPSRMPFGIWYWQGLELAKDGGSVYHCEGKMIYSLALEDLAVIFPCE